MSKMAIDSISNKIDGRRNNGGARLGAGRPATIRVQLEAIDSYYAEKIKTLEKRGRQYRWVKRTRFEVAVDQVLKAGLGVRKGGKRKLNFLKKVAYHSPNHSTYWSFYIDWKAKEVLIHYNKPKRPRLPQWKKDYIAFEKETEKRNKIIKAQNDANSRGMNIVNQLRAKPPEPPFNYRYTRD